MAKQRKNFEKAFTIIERENLLIEKKRSLLSFEMAFFFPLFALLFLVTSFAAGNFLKLFFYVLTLAFIVTDMIYSFIVYKEIAKRQKELEKIIDSKLQ